MWYILCILFNLYLSLPPWTDSQPSRGPEATTMTRRIPHSQDYTFAVSLLRKLCSRSTVVGPWELRAIQRTTLRFSCFPTHGNLGFPHFHLMILFHVVHSDIQHHLEARHKRANRHRGRTWNRGSLYVDATFFKEMATNLQINHRFCDTKSTGLQVQTKDSCAKKG